ncbi:Enkurin [Amphibalanus amphitrite]|uniref:Enkurin n=1 Tax=Amphibalanus amphitrite TaxID=1232801 RepID=A0A6A4WCU1_AMPAM|nr:Enkurin [Amphibalanus amphitrite]KAF0299751.1 Enkurin [Amphibalanus amphitrite]
MPVSLKERKKEGKNFLANNKKEVKEKQNVYVPERKYVDTKGGDKHTLEPSGLKLRYVFKKDFGKTPKYLAKRDVEMREAQEQREREAREAIESQKAKQISEEERQEMLKGLKENWAALNKAYSAQSLCIDNLPKQFRKESLERQMAALEKDIDLVERNTVILIASPRGHTTN